ncbi:hypothetical protein [Anaerovorax odorimutans]|uniref:hypothetical protein n=1 Tax=Anaerovorax odorimutans TaxID=109327 RepID=UPI000417EE06|nr:hypothetical protein [Anaerovorax odorimutans]
MKLRKFLGRRIYEEYYYEDVDLKFIVHKSLINENTRNLILDYLKTGKIRDDICVIKADNIYCFGPFYNEKEQFFEEQKDDYLWFVL